MSDRLVAARVGRTFHIAASASPAPSRILARFVEAFPRLAVEHDRTFARDVSDLATNATTAVRGWVAFYQHRTVKQIILQYHTDRLSIKRFGYFHNKIFEMFYKKLFQNFCFLQTIFSKIENLKTIFSKSSFKTYSADRLTCNIGIRLALMNDLPKYELDDTGRQRTSRFLYPLYLVIFLFKSSA